MTDAPLSEPSDTASDNAPVHVAVIALLVVVVVIAGTASMFMSFHGLCDLVERVEDVHGWLSYVGPIGIDGLQLATLFAIVITATAPPSVRAYLWTVFLGSIGLSVAGNCVDAAARHAGRPGIVLSGVWPALLAAATHVVVMAVRWWQSSRSAATAPEPIEQQIPTAHTLTTVLDELSEPTPKTQAQLQSIARARYTASRSCRQVAIAMQAKGWQVSEKQVERWTKDLRAAEPPAVAAEPSTEPVTAPA